MSYLRLHKNNGTLDVICTRCRQMAGSACESAAADEVEARHFCRMAAREASGLQKRLPNRSVNGHFSNVICLPGSREASEVSTAANVSFVLLSSAFLIYAIPTSLEFFAAQYFNPWLASIFLGDLIGCVWMAAVFKMRKTGLLLYLLLACGKSCLYVFESIPATTLFWLTDLVPAVVIAVVVARASRDLPRRALPR